MPAKLQRIQVLRAAAALSVVLAHAIGDYKHLTGVNLLPMHYLGAAGVDLFFVISGFVMVQSAGSLFATDHAARVFMTRRWFRVAPLYWIVMAAYALLQIAQGKWHVIDPFRILASALFIPVQAADGSLAPFYGIGWTLNFEMFFYAIFAMWIGLRQRWAVTGLALTIGGAVLVGQLIPLVQPLQYWFNPIILDFLFGVMIAVVYERGVGVPPWLASALVALALAAVVFGGVLGFNAVLPEVATAFPRWIAWGLPSAVIVAAVALCRAESFERAAAAGSLLGDASYSMYLLHPIVIILLRNFVSAGPIPSEVSEPMRAGLMGVGHIAVVLTLTALLSVASFMTLERWMIRVGKSVARIRIGGWDPVVAAAAPRLTRSEADI